MNLLLLMFTLPLWSMKTAPPLEVVLMLPLLVKFEQLIVRGALSAFWKDTAPPRLA
jgi:hypothetical protein